MSKQKVSQGFENFMARNEHSFEDAKKAENNMGGIPLPIDAEGEATVLSITADVSKKKADGKGGNPYIRIEYVVNSPEQFVGKKFTRIHTLFDSANATKADRMEWTLNDLENHGLPREIRTGYKAFSEVLDWFDVEDRTIKYKVAASDYGNEGKEVKILRDFGTEEPVVKAVESGRTVTYGGQLYEVVAEQGEDLVIRSPKTGKERTVPITAVEEA